MVLPFQVHQRKKSFSWKHCHKVERALQNVLFPGNFPSKASSRSNRTSQMSLQLSALFFKSTSFHDRDRLSAKVFSFLSLKDLSPPTKKAISLTYHVEFSLCRRLVQKITISNWRSVEVFQSAPTAMTSHNLVVQLQGRAPTMPENRGKQKMEFSFFRWKIIACQFWQKVSHSTGDDKYVKTYQQCMSLTEKTEFPFFVFPIFRYCPVHHL